VCSDYCTGVEATCTAEFGQYTAPSSCDNACPFLPVGDAGASSGDSIACRVTHTGLAATQKNPHCWHAGPYGFGACGDECEAFCKIATGYCVPDAGFVDGGAPPYASTSDCMTACAGFARINGGDAGLGVDGGFNAAGPTGGNTLDCREWHLSKALESTGNQQLHCPHVAATSSTCQ
jgi:hypothetical protein